MDRSSPLAIVRRHWFPGLPADHCGPVLGGGFSGSTVVAVRTPAGDRAVLKAFTPAIPLEHARWIHRLMAHLSADGIGAVPRLFATIDHDRGTPAGPALPPDSGTTTIASGEDGRLWELATWMPGGPVARPTDEQIRTALATVARIHASARRMPGEVPRAGPAPAHGRRIAAARRVLEQGWHALPAAAPGAGPLAAAVAARVAAAAPLLANGGVRRALERIAAADPVVVPLFPVVRDLRVDHLLFTGRERDRDAIGGVIDFHAAGIDTPATDLARLLAGWGDSVDCGGERGFGQGWEQTLRWYDDVSPLSDIELQLVPWLAATAVVFGLDQWFRWVLVEWREFSGSAAVVARIDRLLVDLPAALALLDRRPCPV